MLKRLKGVVCATITPMNEDGSVDYKGVENLARYLSASGIHCLYPNGTNGESLSLSKEEREKIAETVVAVKGNTTVYIQCGAATVAESYSHVRHAKACGADGAGLMTPVFFPVDEAGMRLYYETILDEVTDLPIYVYNIFTRTGNDVSAALLGSLIDKYDNLYGIKFSYPDVLRIRDYVKSPKTRTADALIGCDMLAQSCCAKGGVGWVSGPAAVFGKLHVALYDAVSAGDTEKATALQKALTDQMAAIAGVPEIPAIKYMLKKLGVIACDTCRAPFRPLTDFERAQIDAALDMYLAAYGE